ncbi:unnamed protein product [Blepharisma stoltei]|uniref:Uncharacterized protein n=1 Tax=Blepharisma stoltei TaxID=1481888 RepID=A0AAU9ISG1_9CILI|nr:unnamed protein product [Blepharisma stoltei]
MPIFGLTIDQGYYTIWNFWRLNIKNHLFLNKLSSSSWNHKNLGKCHFFISLTSTSLYQSTIVLLFSYKKVIFMSILI